MGDSFEGLDPTMKAAFEKLESENTNTAAQDICDDKGLKSSMTIDQIILSCIFYHVESFCPGSKDDENVGTFLKNIEWQLDKVVWDWSASPPPPPPVKFGPYDDLVSDDPEGVELVRERLFEFFPSLSYTATQSRGSTFGISHSNDGKGFGPLYFVSKYMMTTAFLSTAQFENQDSLSARIVQARFTGMFRFSCKAMVQFMSDKEMAGAGSSGPESAFPNPADFAGAFDRNFLVIAAALFSESHFQETGEHWTPDVAKFWDENCVAPAVDRSAMPRSLWGRDPLVYGERDAQLHDVPLVDYGPLRAFGSLRQLQDTLRSGGGGPNFPEDYTNAHDSLAQYGGDRADRSSQSKSIHALYRDRICNPIYKYSIEDAVGDPPTGRNVLDGFGGIRDASTASRYTYDMIAPDGLLGNSATKRRDYHGCGLGIASGGCDTRGAPNYEEGSLWSWAYVTSSHDPDVAPGWHRLLYLKAFTVNSCDTNRDQLCNSQINEATGNENFDLDAAVIAQFVREQEAKYQSKLGARLARDKLAADVSGTLNDIGNALGDAGNTISGWFGRRMDEFASDQDRNDRDHRRLYINADGVYDLDAMIAAVAPDEDFAKVAEENWGMPRSQLAARFELIRNQLKPSFLKVKLNGQTDQAQVQTFRQGREALFAARCSDRLKELFPDDPAIQCCDEAPDGQGCTPNRVYASRAECTQRPLELADARTETLSEEYIERLSGIKPPPSPPPSPAPPPPPSPPAPPPPPRPPVAISAAEGRAIALVAQRAFCDSVYLLSAESRCSALAQKLQMAFVLGPDFTPPSLSPQPPPSPIGLPPSPSPPRPRLPDAEDARIVYQSPTHVTLSTYFLGEPETDPETASRGSGNQMGLTNIANRTRNNAINAISDGQLPYHQWAACSDALKDAGSFIQSAGPQGVLCIAAVLVWPAAQNVLASLTARGLGGVGQ